MDVTGTQITGDFWVRIAALCRHNEIMESFSVKRKELTEQVLRSRSIAVTHHHSQPVSYSYYVTYYFQLTLK